MQRLTNLETLELRPFWIAMHGPERPHYVLRFRRGRDGRFSRLEIENRGDCAISMATEDLDTLASDSLEKIRVPAKDSELGAYLRKAFPDATLSRVPDAF